MNTAPIYSKIADVQWISGITAANNTVDITSGTSYLVFTADATNGGHVKELRCKAAPGNNTAATVMRIWLNNGSTPTVAANSIMIGELGIPATTTSASQAQAEFFYLLDRAIPAGYRIYVTVGTAPGGSGAFMAAVFGGKY
jgi:hypothetical protein